VDRLSVLYHRRGYIDASVRARVDTLDVRRRPQIVVTFVIDEGRPLRVTQLDITGVDAIADADAMSAAERARLLRAIPLRIGGVFDRAALESGRDSLVRALRNLGWPRAEALLSYTTDEEARSAAIALRVVAGTRARIGTIDMVTDTDSAPMHVDPRTVRSTFGVRSGDWFNAGELVSAQRALYQLDAFQRVDLQVDQPAALGDSVVNVTVRLVEGKQYAAQGGMGWATLDCVRMQGSFTDRDFLPWAPRLELTGRISKVGLGEPLSGGEGLCQQQARQDPYSRTLNYYVGVTVRHPVTTRGALVPAISLYSTTLSEYRTYLRRTPIGGALALTNPFQARVPSTLSYQVELGRTEAEPAFFCAVFNTCDAPSRAFLQRNTRLAALGYTVAYSGVDNPLQPTRGAALRLEARHASTLIGSDATQQFNRVVGDATWHTSLGGGAVLLAHVRAGVVFGGGLKPSLGGFLPPQERLYAGGPTTVRGFRQNELGPAVYIVPRFEEVEENGQTFLRAPLTVNEERVVPVGGNTLVVGNVELQAPSPVLRGLLSWAAFADVGQLWNRGRVPGVEQQLRSRNALKWTPGVGVRVASPFGSVRIDLGYNGYALPSGAAYFNAPLANGVAPLYCISPGNTLPVTRDANGGLLQASGPCPDSFRPPVRNGFLRRLNPSIWIGQAF
jgi:outer membrane protein insertion porin family/translocation and assembly module TamA